MDEIRENLDEVSYKLLQNYELMRILNTAIENNMGSDNPLSIINLSEIIEEQLKTLYSELDNITLKLMQID